MRFTEFFQSFAMVDGAKGEKDGEKGGDEREEECPSKDELIDDAALKWCYDSRKVGRRAPIPSRPSELLRNDRRLLLAAALEGMNSRQIPAIMPNPNPDGLPTSHFAQSKVDHRAYAIRKALNAEEQQRKQRQGETSPFVERLGRQLIQMNTSELGE